MPTVESYFNSTTERFNFEKKNVSELKRKFIESCSIQNYYPSIPDDIWAENLLLKSELARAKIYIKMMHVSEIGSLLRRIKGLENDLYSARSNLRDS